MLFCWHSREELSHLAPRERGGVGGSCLCGAAGQQEGAAGQYLINLPELDSCGTLLHLGFLPLA